MRGFRPGPGGSRRREAKADFADTPAQAVTGSGKAAPAPQHTHRRDVGGLPHLQGRRPAQLMAQEMGGVFAELMDKAQTKAKSLYITTTFQSTTSTTIVIRTFPSKTAIRW